MQLLQYLICSNNSKEKITYSGSHGVICPLSIVCFFDMFTWVVVNAMIDMPLASKYRTPSFIIFCLQHHCRCCGRTLCHDHSSDQMALPQFGIYTNVRVCSDCYNNSSRPGKDDSPASASAIDDTRDKLSNLNVGVTIDSKSDLISKSAAVMTDCYCGMPLCICEAPVPDALAPVQVQKFVSTVQLNSRPKKNVSTMQTSNMNSTNIQSSSNAKPSVFFSLGQANVTGTNKPDSHYEANGEGLREAIKNNDATAVKKLLDEATVFNRTEIAFILMDHGASLDNKNAQGETPLDCAPTMLQYKIRQMMQEGA